MLYFQNINHRHVWATVEQPMVHRNGFERAPHFCAYFTIDSPPDQITEYLRDANNPTFFTTEQAAVAAAFNAAAERIRRL